MKLKAIIAKKKPNTNKRTDHTRLMSIRLQEVAGSFIRGKTCGPTRYSVWSRSWPASATGCWAAFLRLLQCELLLGFLGRHTPHSEFSKASHAPCVTRNLIPIKP